MTAANDDGSGARDAEPTKADQNQRVDCRSAEGVGKAFDILRAQLQMSGCGLHAMADRGYFVSHGQMLVQIGGRA